jgi:predicted nucleic acid-binding protein
VKTLVDTCVLSEAQRARGDRRVRARLESIPDEDLFLSVVTIGEIVRGIGLLPAGNRRSVLDAWVRDIEEHHARRILPVDARVARIWGELDAGARGNGVTIPAVDGLIAATAIRHDLAVMTRNTAHFAATGVRLIDPWEQARG